MKARKTFFFVAVLVVLFGAASARADLTDGLVAHWKLDGDANDSAGSNDGTLVNGPIWTTGQIGDALDFDGVDDYVDVGDQDSLDFVASESFSISTWFKLSQDVSGLTPSIVDKRKWQAAPVYGYYKEGYNLVVYQNKLRFGIEDVSNRATVGGCVANNASLFLMSQQLNQ